MSETLRDLVVSLSLQTDNFTRNIKSVSKQIAEAESQFKLAAAGVEGFERTATGLATQLSTLERRLSLQKDAVNQYQRALEAANNKLSECYNRQNDYAQRLETAKAAQRSRSRLRRRHSRYAPTLQHWGIRTRRPSQQRPIWTRSRKSTGPLFRK